MGPGGEILKGWMTMDFAWGVVVRIIEKCTQFLGVTPARFAGRYVILSAARQHIVVHLVRLRREVHLLGPQVPQIGQLDALIVFNLIVLIAAALILLEIALM